ncbi:unnamed protein product [Leuciscus chuanchicus]
MQADTGCISKPSELPTWIAHFVLIQPLCTAVKSGTIVIDNYQNMKTVFLTLDAFQNTVERFGRLDIVINNAGINNEKNWEKTIEVNLTSVIKGTYLALEHMSKEYGKEGGVIINVSSMAAFLHSPHQPVYTATKYGVIGFSRAIADASEQGNYGVRINTLCPAFVDTPLLRTVEHEETMGKFVKYKDEFKQRIDKYGVLKPSLIAEGMLRIITDESLNGAVMKITCSKGIHFHTYEPLSA